MLLCNKYIFMPKLVSVNVSLPKEVTHNEQTFTTGIFKEPIQGIAKVNKLNIEGDGQADLKYHGGEERAVYVYSYDHYAYWEKELNRNDFTMGQFGENLTVEGMMDDDVCIGDQYRIGSVVFEVSQPRIPCFKLAARMNDNRITKLFFNSGKLGFYMRVLEEGNIIAGDEITTVKKHELGLSITKVNALLHFDKEDYTTIKTARDIQALSPLWKDHFDELLAKEK